TDVRRRIVAMGLSDSCCYFGCCVLQSRRHGEIQPGVREDFPGFLGVRPFEAYDHGNRDVHAFRGLDYSVRDTVAADNSAEDIDPHGPDVLVRQDDGDPVGHGLEVPPTADVEEIGGLTAGELDDVHRRHRKACTVHHAADVPVELDVVQIEF